MAKTPTLGVEKTPKFFPYQRFNRVIALFKEPPKVGSFFEFSSKPSFMTSSPTEATALGAKPRIFPILLVNFIGTLGYSILLPFLVILVTKFGGDELAFGIMGATYSLFQFVGAPVLGRWSDRIGRRKVLLLSQGGTFIAWILFLIALLLPVEDFASMGPLVISLPLAVLFLARALDGITGGNVSVAYAYLADISTDETRQANFGRMGAAAHLGFVAGPIIAGLLGASVYEEILPVIASMLISFIAIIVIAVRLPESKTKLLAKPADPKGTRKMMGQEQKECHKMKGQKEHGFRKILSLPNIPFILGFYFLIILAFNFYYVAFPMMAIQTLLWDTFHLGIFFSAYGGILVLTETYALTWLSKRFGESQLIPGGIISMIIGFSLFMTGEVAFVYTGAVFVAFGNSIAWPSFLSLLAGIAGKKYQGAIQGAASSMGSLAAIVGLVIGGFIFSQLSSWTFLIPIGLMVILFFLAFRLRRVQKSLPGKH